MKVGGISVVPNKIEIGVYIYRFYKQNNKNITDTVFIPAILFVKLITIINNKNIKPGVIKLSDRMCVVKDSFNYYIKNLYSDLPQNEILFTLYDKNTTALCEQSDELLKECLSKWKKVLSNDVLLKIQNLKNILLS